MKNETTMANKKIDMKISQKIAEEASKKINRLKKTIKENNEIHISVLNDVVNDFRKDKRFFIVILSVLCFVVLVSIFSMFFFGIYNQKLMKDVSVDCTKQLFEFLENYDFNTSAEISVNDSSNDNGNISFK